MWRKHVASQGHCIPALAMSRRGECLLDDSSPLPSEVRPVVRSSVWSDAPGYPMPASLSCVLAFSLSMRHRMR